MSQAAIESIHELRAKLERKLAERHAMGYEDEGDAAAALCAEIELRAQELSPAAPTPRHAPKP